MQFSSKNICPFCLKNLAPTATWCEHCHCNLPSNKQKPFSIPPKAEFYEIVPDGAMFGIALQGKIKIHGLEKENAQSVLTTLNRRCEMENLDK